MIELREITQENLDDILELQVGEHQRELVASNAVSLAQCHVQPECIPLAIYRNDLPVGFLLYCLDRDDGQYWLYRLMIARSQQNKGYGRAAMKLLLERIKNDKSHRRIVLGVNPAGGASVYLYRSLGFVPTGQVFGKEQIMALEYGEPCTIGNINHLPCHCLWQDAAGLVTKQLGAAGGSQRLYVNLDTLPPNSYSTKYHSHGTQEEFFLVLRGSGVLRLEGVEQAVKQGDFFAKTPGLAHCFYNDSNEPMELLDVGTVESADVCFYPDEYVRVEKVGNQRRAYKAGTPLADWSSEPNPIS